MNEQEQKTALLVTTQSLVSPAASMSCASSIYPSLWVHTCLGFLARAINSHTNNSIIRVLASSVGFLPFLVLSLAATLERRGVVSGGSSHPPIASEVSLTPFLHYLLLWCYSSNLPIARLLGSGCQHGGCQTLPLFDTKRLHVLSNMTGHPIFQTTPTRFVNPCP